MDKINASASSAPKRRDAAEKINGTLAYLDDLPFEGLYGAVIRSSEARGVLRGIVYDPSFDWEGFVTADARDIPAENICPGLMDDQPFLAEQELRFYGEPVALIACAERERLREALAHIRVECEPLKAVLTLEDSCGLSETIYGEENCFKTISIRKGETQSCFASAEFRVFEGVYETAGQEHLYLEPQGMEAFWRDGKIVLKGSMQCPAYVAAALQRLAAETVEVEQTPTGGGFGGKEEYPSLLAGYAYILARKSGEDVRIIYGRSEDMAYTTKRHPARVAYRTAVDEAGLIRAMEVRFDIDAGAYCTLSPVVLSRAVLHCCGLYEIPSVTVLGRAMASNTPPSGAFRGFGAPQAIFALERHMDDLARWLGSDPMRFRRRHLPHKESTTLTGAAIAEAADLGALFEQAMRESDFSRRREALARQRREEGVLRGIGMALFMHGGGFTGSGEAFLASRVRLHALAQGSVRIEIISTEMGQGALTVLPAMVAQELQISPENVHYAVPNTRSCADSGPTVASRTTMVIGGLLRRAARQLREAVCTACGEAYSGDAAFREALKRYLERGGPALFEAAFEQPEGVVWDEEHYRGQAYLGYSLGCYIAEVAIDPVSYRASVTDVYALSDIGRPVNLALAESQVCGGVVQGMGYALQEELYYRDGRLLNARLSDYMIPIAADTPPMEVRFYAGGEKPKGLGELPMDGSGAAVANAIADALGVGVKSLPVTAQKIMEMLQ